MTVLTDNLLNKETRCFPPSFLHLFAVGRYASWGMCKLENVLIFLGSILILNFKFYHLQNWRKFVRRKVKFFEPTRCQRFVRLEFKYWESLLITTCCDKLKKISRHKLKYFKVFVVSERFWNPKNWVKCLQRINNQVI